MTPRQGISRPVSFAVARPVRRSWGRRIAARGELACQVAPLLRVRPDDVLEA